MKAPHWDGFLALLPAILFSFLSFGVAVFGFFAAIDSGNMFWLLLALPFIAVCL